LLQLSLFDDVISEKMHFKIFCILCSNKRYIHKMIFVIDSAHLQNKTKTFLLLEQLIKSYIINLMWNLPSNPSFLMILSLLIFQLFIDCSSKRKVFVLFCKCAESITNVILWSFLLLSFYLKMVSKMFCHQTRAAEVIIQES